MQLKLCEVQERVKETWEEKAVHLNDYIGSVGDKLILLVCCCCCCNTFASMNAIFRQTVGWHSEARAEAKQASNEDRAKPKR